MASTARPEMPDLRSVPADQLELYMQRLFKIGDKDGNGVLDSYEFRDLLRKSGFNLSNDEITEIMHAADTNKDGVIQYEEFVPAMRALIHRLTDMYTEALPNLMEVPPLELESYFRRLFQICDATGAGLVTHEQFEMLLKKSGFNFHESTIKHIMAHADPTPEGTIEYEEYLAAIMSIVVQSPAEWRPMPTEEESWYSNPWGASGQGAKGKGRGGKGARQLAPGQTFKSTVDVDPRAPKKEPMPDIKDVPSQQLELYMQRLFKLGDKDGNGVLDAMEFRDLLRKSGFGLDTQTITKIMHAADINKDGVIQYEEFVPAMRALIKNIGSLEEMPMPDDSWPPQTQPVASHGQMPPGGYYGYYPGMMPASTPAGWYPHLQHYDAMTAHVPAGQPWHGPLAGAGPETHHYQYSGKGRYYDHPNYGSQYYQYAGKGAIGGQQQQKQPPQQQEQLYGGKGSHGNVWHDQMYNRDQQMMYTMYGGKGDSGKGGKWQAGKGSAKGGSQQRSSAAR